MFVGESRVGTGLHPVTKAVGESILGSGGGKHLLNIHMEVRLRDCVCAGLQGSWRADIEGCSVKCETCENQSFYIYLLCSFVQHHYTCLAGPMVQNMVETVRHHCMM